MEEMQMNEMSDSGMEPWEEMRLSKSSDSSSDEESKRDRDHSWNSSCNPNKGCCGTYDPFSVGKEVESHWIHRWRQQDFEDLPPNYRDEQSLFPDGPIFLRLWEPKSDVARPKQRLSSAKHQKGKAKASTRDRTVFALLR